MDPAALTTSDKYAPRIRAQNKLFALLSAAELMKQLVMNKHIPAPLLERAQALLEDLEGLVTTARVEVARLLTLE